MTRKIYLLGLISILAGCTSAPKAIVASGDHAGEEQVLARIDDMSARPSWVQESTPFRVENGYVISTGQTVIPIDHRLEAAYRISANNAKAGISSAIEQRLEFMFQNSEEGTTMDQTQARYIGSEASKMTTSSLRLDHNYWEKIAVINEGGQRVVQYRVFSTVKMPESDFKAAVLQAIRRQNGKAGISQDFADKVNKQWDSFVSEGQASQGHAPAQVKSQAKHGESDQQQE